MNRHKFADPVKLKLLCIGLMATFLIFDTTIAEELKASVPTEVNTVPPNHRQSLRFISIEPTIFLIRD